VAPIKVLVVCMYPAAACMVCVGPPIAGTHLTPPTHTSPGCPCPVNTLAVLSMVQQLHPACATCFLTPCLVLLRRCCARILSHNRTRPCCMEWTSAAARCSSPSACEQQQRLQQQHMQDRCGSSAVGHCTPVCQHDSRGPLCVPQLVYPTRQYFGLLLLGCTSNRQYSTVQYSTCPSLSTH
jgi:hypothetical protein